MNQKRFATLFNLEQFSTKFNTLVFGEDFMEGNALKKKLVPANIPDMINEKTGGSISQGQLSNYKNAKSAPSAEALVCLAQFFNVSTDYLLGLTDSTSKEEVDQEMNKKYNLSDKAMRNLARWKKTDDKFRIFSEFKILQAIMEDEHFLSDLTAYFGEHFNLSKEVPNNSQKFRIELRLILSETQFLFNDFVEKIYNKLVAKPSSDNRLVKYPHRKWGQDTSSQQE